MKKLDSTTLWRHTSQMTAFSTRLGFLPAAHRAPPVGALILASELRVLLGWVRRHSDGQPDHGVDYQLELVLARRERGDQDLPAHPDPSMAWVVPAVLATPMLHAPIDMPALIAAFEDHLLNDAPPPALETVLLPRPPGAPLRQAVWPGVGWRAVSIPSLPHRRSLAVQQSTLHEHPGVLEVLALRDRSQGRLLSEEHERIAVLDSDDEALGVVTLPSLAEELTLMCPDGSVIRKRYPGRPKRPRGSAPDDAAWLALTMAAMAMESGDEREAVVRAGTAWLTALSAADSSRQEALSAALRDQGRRRLRQLWERPERPRCARRKIQPYLVADLRCAARPFPSSLLWRSGGSEDAVVASAELLRDALRQGEVLDAVRLAADGCMERVRPAPLWSDGWSTVRSRPMVVAQVEVKPGHPLHRRGVGAMPMANPRSRKQADWHGRWGCQRRRLRQSKAALRKPVVGMLPVHSLQHQHASTEERRASDRV